jgi:hypothetical protein
MPIIPFPEWKPDVSDYEGSSSQVITNALPQGDGYGPFPGISALTQALPATCRGFINCRNADGSILIIAGTSTKLYKLNNTDLSWSDVSLGSSTYSALSSGFNWSFVQFNNLVFATQQNAVLQVFDLTSPTAFANAAGSPPQASYVSVINRFLVLSGLLSQAYRVQWSGLNNVNASTSWDNVTAQSNFQDMADGGLVRGVTGGDQYGIVFQDSACRSMIFNPGSPEVFDFYKISEQEGIFAPQSAIKAGGSVFFISTQGFRMIPPGGVPTPIGKEKFDRFFFNNVDAGNLQYCIGAADPKSPRIIWVFKSQAGAQGFFDSAILYDWQLQRATLASLSGEYISSLATPGITLESLDKQAPGVITISGAVSGSGGAIKLTISGVTSGLTNLNNENSVEVYGVTGTTEANGNWPFVINDTTHITLTGSTFTNNYISGGAIGGAIDALTLSLDSFSTSPLATMAVANSSHVIGFLAGSNLQATLQTGEQELDASYRMRVQNVRPITDASTASVSLLIRERLQNTPVATSPATVDSLGNVKMNVSTRLARGLLTIPAGSSWTYATGLRPEMVRDGKQ